MIYSYSKNGFFVDNEDQIHSCFEVINFILEEKNVELKFSDKRECIYFLYYFYYPILLQALIKIGSFTWINPYYDDYINEDLWLNSRFSPDLEKEIKNSIISEGMFFPFLGISKDQLWYGKHRWEILVRNKYNKFFLFIVADNISQYSFYFPIITDLTIRFEKNFLGLHINSKEAGTKIFANFSDFLGSHYKILKEPLDFIENQENFYRFLNQKGQWKWISKIKFDF